MKGPLDQADRKMVQESPVIPVPWARSPSPRVNFPDSSKEIETLMLQKLRLPFQELISKIVVNHKRVPLIIKPSRMAIDKNSSENSIVEILGTTQTSLRVRWASSPVREQDPTALLNLPKVKSTRTKENFHQPFKPKNKLIRKIHLKVEIASWETRIDSIKNLKLIMISKRTGSPLISSKPWTTRT